MSYEKIRSIKIDQKQGKVFITCACNNVRPLIYEKHESDYLSKMLKEEGKEKVEIHILKAYEESNFQQGNNKFRKALKVLKFVFKEEYQKFNWNNNYKYGSPESKEVDRLRETKEFEELLKKALNYKIPKNKFVLSKKTYNGLAYGKACPRRLYWSWNKTKATKFDFKEEAENYLSWFSGLNDVEIVEV